MTEETPRERRTRHRAERQQVLTAPADQRREQARQLLERQREQRRAARGGSGRAPAMTVEERRAAIVAVAVPMLIEQGGNVKTSEIAAAAGIAEGTLFRAFRDKQELFVACLYAVLESEAEVAEIRRIDRSLPLVERLTAAVRSVADYQTRLWSVMVALRSAGVDPRSGEKRFDGPPTAMVRISSAIAGLFDADDLRVPTDLAARLLLGSVFSNRLQSEGLGDSGADLDELVDLFLHGVLRQPDGGKS
ncbi:MAG TPA: TetR family transcriptional regulator [Pseudonocardiaceae bacterium]|nr:TetR family transcriptional regulator [Pseudonocardiaceae bacterium]